MAIATTPAPEKTVASVVSWYNLPSTDPNRRGQMDTVVHYQAGPGHNFAVTIPTKDATQTQITTAIKAHYKAQVKPLMNMQIPLD